MDDPAQTIFERVRGREEEAAVEPDHRHLGKHLVAGCSSSSRKTWVPASRPREDVRVGRHRDEPDEREPDPDDHTGENAEDEVPRIAATAIQKSNLCTRASRRISGRFIMPMTTASMIRAASTGLGRLENSGARTSRVSRTVTPDVREARPVLAQSGR